MSKIKKIQKISYAVYADTKLIADGIMFDTELGIRIVDAIKKGCNEVIVRKVVLEGITPKVREM